MPLNRKWRSMDFFGSHESLTRDDNHQHHRHHHHRLSAKEEHHHSLLHLKNPFRHRLSSSSSKEDNSQSRRDKKEEGEPPDTETTLIQRCVIIQKDEKGYGFTVSGDNPVYVASVKSEGAASRSGVQQGDKILKVNGTLVTNRNHLDVVKLIKSGSYVALTLLGKPNSTNQALNSTPSFNIPSNAWNARVTAPKPVDNNKERELWQEKVNMTKAMHATAYDDYQKLHRMYLKSPSEKLHAQLLEKERTVKALENQLQSLKPDGEDGGPTSSAFPRSRYPDSEPSSLESFSVQSWQARRRDSGSDIRHAKQSSVPSLVSHQTPEMRSSGAAVARSKSDATARKSKATSTFYVPRQGVPNASEWKSLTPMVLDMSSLRRYRPQQQQDDEEDKTSQPFKPASSLPTPMTPSDFGSMSDSPQTSPSISPTPNDTQPNGQDEDSTPKIITIDDEDLGEGNGQLPDVKLLPGNRPLSPFIARITGPEANDPGPFVDIRHLENKPAHMAVLLRYLISNSDPSYVLFHIIVNAYSRTSGKMSDLRKWAYEIFSTFVVKSAPLSIAVDDNLISQIDNILTIKGIDNETVLRNLFYRSQQAIQGDIADLLADFRSKKDLGMGNFYGFQKIETNMDKQTEARVAEEILIPYLEKVGYDDSSSKTISDKDQATSWAVATFLRLSSSSSKSHHNAILDRVQTFINKDQRSLKFRVTRSGRAKSVKSHQFNLQHFYYTTLCNMCGQTIWGVGYQGYQCQNCEINLHKQCTDQVTDVCPGKGKASKRSSIIPNVLQPRKTSTTNPLDPSSGVRPHSEIHSPPYPDIPGSGPLVQPIPKDPEHELASALSIIAGIPTGHSVQHIVKRYHDMNSPTGPGPGLGVPGGTQFMTTSTGDNERRGSTDLNRSGSLNNKGEKGDRPPRRAKSDVDVDPETFKAINQSGSSSASSMSNRSGESPSNSTDNVSDMHVIHQEDPDIELEPELPPLKQVLGEAVFHKLKPKEVKRQDILNELIYTERAHLRNLKIMDNLFNKPMLLDNRWGEKEERKAVKELALGLFPNMEQMISLHESLTKDLRERQKSTPVIKEVYDILLKRHPKIAVRVHFRVHLLEFDGENGDNFRKACAEYCRNQSHTLQALKRTIRKNPKFSQFLSDMEANPLCRRLHLKDLVPSQVHRLTKYPLLIDNLLKYSAAMSVEHKQLERALERSKHILAYVNQAVKECENYHKLKDIQKKMDKKMAETNDPAMLDIKALDLTKGHKLIFDSPLTMKLKANRTIDLHVLLLDSILVMLQKQDDRYLLRYQNSNAGTVRDSSIKEERYTHSPMLYVRNILARHVATDKKSFFVVNMSESRAQMYEFIAATADLRMKWCDMINEQTERVKKAGKDEQGHMVPPASLPDIEVERQQIISISRPGSTAIPGDDQNLDDADGLSRSEVSDFITDTDLIQPDEVNVGSVISVQATPIRSTEELLHHNANVISSALEERHRLLMQVLGLPYTPAVTSPSSISDHVQQEEIEEMERMVKQGSDDPLEEQVMTSQEKDGGHPDGNNNLERTLLMRAVLKTNEFIQLIVAASMETALQHQHQQQESKRPETEEVSISPVASPPRRMSAVIGDDTSVEGDSMGSSTASSTQSQVPASSPGQSQQQQQPQTAQANVSLPMEQLKGMAVEMNSIMAKLMSTMNSGSEERQRWREEIQEAQRKLNALKEQQRQLTLSGAVPPDRDPSECYDEMESSQTLSSPVNKPPLSPLSPTSIPSQPSEQDLGEDTLIVSETSIDEEMHHGIQEAIMDESVETLASEPSTEIATMVSQGGEDGVRVIEVSLGEYDDDDDNEVSVRDLPLPDIGTIQATGLDPQPTSSPQLLDAVDLDDSEDEDDDNETLVSKGYHPDLSSLSSVSIEGAHPSDVSTSAGSNGGAGPQDARDLGDDSHGSSESRSEAVDGGDDSKDDECTPIEI